MSTACSTRKIRGPLKIHGGKAYLARPIIRLMPTHRLYVEPFLGGGSVLLNKEPSAVEIASDIDPDLIAFWRELQTNPDGLAAFLADKTYDPATFAASSEWASSDDPTTKAAGLMIRKRMSRNGLGRDFSQSNRLRGKTQPGGAIMGDANAWRTILAQLERIASRVANVTLWNRDALQVIRELDAADTVIYCDPPYLHSTRTAPRMYRHEVATANRSKDADLVWHLDLIETLRAFRGTVLLSGYPSAPYDRELQGWRRYDFAMPNHSGQGKTKGKRVECVWVKRAK
jgi:DNA adenine methylase